jgi:hypothetical protein
MSMKNSNDTIGNRTRDRPACSALPQSTLPQRTQSIVLIAIRENVKPCEKDAENLVEIYQSFQITKAK